MPTDYPRNACAYCDASGRMTKDHVPPKELFLPPRPELIPHADV